MTVAAVSTEEQEQVFAGLDALTRALLTVVAHEADAGNLRTDTARTTALRMSRELIFQACARLPTELAIPACAERATVVRTFIDTIAEQEAA